MNQQQGDVVLYQSVNDGDIFVTEGVIEMSGGFETAVYLSLFGGNEDDNGSDGNSRNWWGNLDEQDKSKHLRSETQNLLLSLPATTGNFRRIVDAVKRDLNWLREKNIANSVEVSVSMPELNKIKIAVQIDEFSTEYLENWKAQS